MFTFFSKKIYRFFLLSVIFYRPVYATTIYCFQDDNPSYSPRNITVSEEEILECYNQLPPDFQLQKLIFKSTPFYKPPIDPDLKTEELSCEKSELNSHTPFDFLSIKASLLSDREESVCSKNNLEGFRDDR